MSFFRFREQCILVKKHRKHIQLATFWIFPLVLVYETFLVQKILQRTIIETFSLKSREDMQIACLMTGNKSHKFQNVTTDEIKYAVDPRSHLILFYLNTEKKLCRDPSSR